MILSVCCLDEFKVVLSIDLVQIESLFLLDKYMRIDASTFISNKRCFEVDFIFFSRRKSQLINILRKIC